MYIQSIGAYKSMKNGAEPFLFDELDQTIILGSGLVLFFSVTLRTGILPK